MQQHPAQCLRVDITDKTTENVKKGKCQEKKNTNSSAWDRQNLAEMQ